MSDQEAQQTEGVAGIGAMVERLEIWDEYRECSVRRRAW